MEVTYDYFDETTRKVTSEIGNYVVERRDPHSLWFIVPELGGATAKELSGAYTTPDTAYTAIKNYLENKKTRRA